DHDHSVNAGMNDLTRAVKNHPRLRGFQWNHIEHRIVNPVAVTEEVIHREDNEERLDYRSHDAADQPERPPDNHPAQPIQLLQQIALCIEVTDINVPAQPAHDSTDHRRIRIEQ